MKSKANHISFRDKRVQWKNFIRRYPMLASVFEFIFNPALVSHRARNRLIKGLPEKAKILNIGSGAKRFGNKCVNLDIEPFANVDIVADARSMPFPEESFDLVILEYVIEHVGDSQKMMLEIYRVLKGAGLVYSTVPFMQSYHGNPQDYYRFTIEGVVKLWDSVGFTAVECLPSGGPTSALVCMLKEYLAVLFSFNSRTLYSVLSQFFIIIFFPLKFMDFLLVSNRNAHNIAYSFYYIGEKAVKVKNEK
jgi:SAM-dependent methyltransferase